MNPLSIAPVLAAHALNSLVFGILLLPLAWMVLRAMTKYNAATRFTVLYSALLLILALLFLRTTGSQVEGSYHAALPSFAFPVQWSVFLFYGWVAVALGGIARIIAGLFRLRQLRRGFLPLDLPELHTLLTGHRRSKRTVELVHSSLVRVPAAIGFFRPAIVLPSWAIQELSPEELHAAVLHELAHVDRWDDWTNLAQKFIRALLFFHPAVWWLDSRLAIEREMSCDDAVVAETGGAERYARCLISLAEKSFMKRPMSLVQAAVGHMKQMTVRIGKIMDGQERRVASPWKPALAVLTVFSVIGVVATENIPQLVTFQAEKQPGASILAPSHATPSAMPVGMRKQPLMAHSRVRKTNFVAPVHVRKERNDRNENLLARRSAHAPSVVNAAAKQQTPSEFLYVVMETRDYDGSGMVRITTSVWKVRFIIPPAMREESAPPHST